MVLKKRTNEILIKFPEEIIIIKSINANFFGVESLGSKQIRGNGVLLLTLEVLYFEMWYPKRIIKIPIKDIKRVDDSKWHLRKSKGQPLVKIYFINKEGKEDSAAWLVKDNLMWINTINNKINL